MLLPGSRLIDAPVLGLQTGNELARTTKPIIDPATLTILAYELEGQTLDNHPSLLRIADVREFSDIGLIVDSSDEFVSPVDIIKLNEVYKLHFDIIHKPVLDERNRKLGKVIGYTINTASFAIQQLNIKRPLLKSFNDAELLLHRSHITEINDKAIIVHSEKQRIDPITQTVRGGNYVNPFRKSPQTEQQSSDQR